MQSRKESRGEAAEAAEFFDAGDYGAFGRSVAGRSTFVESEKARGRLRCVRATWHVKALAVHRRVVNFEVAV